jgi:serine/threonine-protein kinase
VRSLKREAALFGLLKERVGEHPNIVAIESVYFDEPPPYYILMQHVAGQDLVSWCESQGGIEKVLLEARLEIVAQIADALQAAHDSGVIHRDVKPSNILVSNQGGNPIHAYLTDFGIGQIISDEIRSQLSVSGFSQAGLESASLSGTQLYMAPELFWGKPASIRSDIYALGVVLYQLLAGDFRRPVTTDWAKQIKDQLLREDLEKCFAGDPQDRFTGAAQLAEQLRCLQERREAFEKQQTILRERERAAYRRGILRTAALALVVVGLVSGLAIYAFVQRHEAQESGKKANAARDQADGLINFMLYDLRDKLRPIGRLDILNDVAKKAKEYLDSLPKELAIASRQEQQAVMLINLGDVQIAQSRLLEALNAYQQSLTILKRLADQDKSNLSWQRDLSTGYGKVGNVLLAQGKLQEALNAYQQDLALSKRLAEQDKSNSSWQRELSVSYEEVGNALVAQGKLQEALDAYRQSLTLLRTLASQDKSNAGRQRDLSVGYEKVGDILLAQGKLQETLDAYRQSLTIRQTLTDQDKSNSGWQWDLSVSYEKVGDVLVAQGKLQEALEAYRQYLAIAKVLAEQDKTNSGWQRDLIVSLYKVATTMAKIGGDDDGGREQTMLQEALHLTDEYAGMDRQRLIDDLNRALQQSVH